MKSFLRVLASVLFLSALTRSAPIEGKENVFDYKMSVGKEDGEQGFFIETKVLVKRHSDNTYNLQVSYPLQTCRVFYFLVHVIFS